MKDGFQSLFYWKYLFNSFIFLSTPFPDTVSILVLLEVPLQLAAFDVTVNRLIMFQSLFYWKYLFNNLIGLLSICNALWVSILVLLEVPLQPSCTSIISSTSLVSILVLLEVPLQPGCGNAYLTVSWEFQSLFYWKYLFNHCRWRIPQVRENVSILVLLEVPLQQVQHEKRTFEVTVFQSLFYWKYLFNMDWDI